MQTKVKLAGAADGDKLHQTGDEYGYKACHRPEEHGADGHDGILQIKGQERHFEVKEHTAYVGQRHKDAHSDHFTDMCTVLHRKSSLE